MHFAYLPRNRLGFSPCWSKLTQVEVWIFLSSICRGTSHFFAAVHDDALGFLFEDLFPCNLHFSFARTCSCWLPCASIIVWKQLLVAASKHFFPEMYGYYTFLVLISFVEFVLFILAGPQKFFFFSAACCSCGVYSCEAKTDQGTYTFLCSRFRIARV